MPAYGVSEVQGQTDRDASIPTIEYPNGGEMRYARVISITQSTGITPSTAEIAVSNVDTTDEGRPVTLGFSERLSERTLQYYSRIRIKQGSVTLFTGSLTDRVDASRSGITTLNYSDDRVAMSKIPLVGCWVRDPYDGTVKWVDRYLPILNPGGFRNCVYGEVSGQKFPVFSYQAEAGTAGRSSDEAGSGEDGVAAFWTAQRALEYIRLCSTVAPPEAGDNAVINTIKVLNSDHISWPEGTTQFDSELMHDRLPETSLIGMSVLGAIHKILEISGEYGLTLRYDDYAEVELYRKDNVRGGDGIDLNLQTSGAASGFAGICEYQVVTDATHVYTGARINGSPYQVESSFHYNPAGGGYGYGTDGTLVPGWTQDEGQAFREMIIGDDDNYAQAPVDPARPLDGWVAMDGNGGRPLIRPLTVAAIQMARACFPRAYRAFRLPSDDSSGGYSAIQTMLDASGGEYAQHPRLNVPRMPGPEQLQPYYEDAGDIRGRIRYPVRIRVATNDSPTTSLHDVTANTGLRITDDGLIWLDGLTDESDSYDRIYEGSFLIDPDDVKLKHFYVNMWIPGDWRVGSAVDIFDGETEDVRDVRPLLDPDSFDGKHKGMEFYVLDPDGYLDEHQVSSEPSPAGKVAGADGVPQSQPLTRRLRTDYDQISKHARRRIKGLTAIRRSGEVRMPTIRTDLRSGMMIRDIVRQGGGDKWSCDRPIRTIKFNYEEQKTSIEME